MEMCDTLQMVARDTLQIGIGQDFLRGNALQVTIMPPSNLVIQLIVVIIFIIVNIQTSALRLSMAPSIFSFSSFQAPHLPSLLHDCIRTQRL